MLKIILPLYRFYLFLNKLSNKAFSLLSTWLLAPLTSRYLVYIVFIVVSLVIFVNNISAVETRLDETSVNLRNSVLFKLSSDMSDELVEEKVHLDKRKIIYNYLSDSFTKPYLSRSDRIFALLKNDFSKFEFSKGDTLLKPNIISTKANLQLRDSIIEYSVEEGDTLSSIARKFGLKIQTILWANNLTFRSFLKPNQKLIIPPVDGIVYKVKKYDTLSKIAKKYSIDVNKILSVNRLSSVKDIQPGQILILPDAKQIRQGVRVSRIKRVSKKRSVYTQKPVKFKKISSSKKTRLLWPTDMRIITQYYSWRHKALDIDGTYKTRNYAADDGVVIRARGGWNYGYGNYVIIDHGKGMRTLYAHFSKIFVREGQRVKRGQVLGMVGSTGRSTGTHLHFEVRINGRRVNPLRYLR